jgi:hypothetical protein
MSRVLIIAGAVLMAVGLAWPVLTKGPWGRLPGDLVVKKENFTFYFPLMTSLVLSILFSVVLWFFRRR